MVGKRLEIGDDLYPWNTLERTNEFLDRVEKAREELRDKKRITYFIDKSYKWSYKKRPSFLYKQTVSSFRPLELGGAPRYKDHKIQFIVVSVNGRELSRFITSNPEEVAFCDMKEGIVREENRELTPMERNQLEKLRLEKEVAELKAKLEQRETVEENNNVEEVEEEGQPVTEEKKRGRPKGKKNNNQISEQE